MRFALAADGPDPGEVARAASRLAQEVVRALAARWLGVADATVHVGRRCRCGSTGHGRPVVTSHPGLHVSVAHCGRRVAAAVTGLGPVGVDLERGRTVDLATVGPGVLGPGDDPVTDSDTFLQVWVRKEALVKATGDGVTAPLDQVRVTAGAWAGPRISYCGSEIDGYVVALPAPPGHCAAVAVLGRIAPAVTVMEE